MNSIVCLLFSQVERMDGLCNKKCHGDFRRNIVTSGVRLNALVGQRFTVDGIAMEGVRLCEPCAYLAELLTDKLLPTMVGRCGLRARILQSGVIRIDGVVAS